MPNISSLTMPDGIVYAIKDSQARKDIEEIKRNGSGSGSGSFGGDVVRAVFTKNTTKKDLEAAASGDSGSGDDPVFPGLDAWTCDKTVAELEAARDAGSVIFAYLVSEGEEHFCSILEHDDFGGFHGSSVKFNEEPLTDDSKIIIHQTDVSYMTHNNMVIVTEKYWTVDVTPYTTDEGGTNHR